MAVMHKHIGHQVVIIIQDDVLAGTVRHQPLYGTLQAIDSTGLLARVAFTSGVRIVVPLDLIAAVDQRGEVSA